MPKFFNSSRGPVTATIGSDVIMFPSKQWTLIDADLGISSSLQSLVDQKILKMAEDSSPLKAATASKPNKAAREAAAKAAASSKAASKADVKPVKTDPPKVAPPKDVPSKNETPELAPAPAPSTSKV
jgi:hypothetical protein